MPPKRTRASTQKESVSDPAPTAGGKRKIEEVEVEVAPTDVQDQQEQGDNQAASPSPAKVPKVAPTFMMHERHWYLDGNVLLQTGTQRFKVHRSRLVTVSTFFEILFDIYYVRENPAYANLEDSASDYIHELVSTADIENDLLLFRLDCEGHDHDVPNPAQFAAFLDGIYDGLNYAFDPPSMDKVVRLTQAASTFSATPLLNYTKKYLDILFPDSHTKLSAEPSVYVAAQGLLLADCCDEFDAHLPTIFYDLARAPVAAIREYITVDNDPYVPPKANGDNTSSILRPNDVYLTPNVSRGTKFSLFARIPRRHYLRLNVLQKHLSASWDDIINEIIALQVPVGRCDGSCGMKSSAVGHVLKKAMSVKESHIHDPIMGIRALINENLLKQYCHGCNSQLTKTLKDRRSLIWKSIRTVWV